MHTNYDGFACLALSSEGNVVHMVGIDPHENEGCEMWIERKVPIDHGKDSGIPEMVQERIIKDVRYSDGKFASFIMGDLIRCRDCAKAEEDASIGTYWCDGREVPSSHYCSYGVRKDV